MSRSAHHRSPSVAPASVEGSGPAASVARTAGDAGPEPGGVGADVVSLTDRNVRTAWATFLTRYPWDTFATLTYAGSAWAEEKVVRNFRHWLFRWQVETAKARGLCNESVHARKDGYDRVVGARRKLSGSWWNAQRKGRARVVWALGVEPQRSGKLHAHAVMRWPSMLADPIRRVGWHLWTGPKSSGGLDHGFSRIEPPRCQHDVAGYVSKYVVKGGELYLSPSFDAARLEAV